MNVVWSPLAIERAYEEASYIAEDKPDAAFRWLERLFASTDRLVTYPRSGSRIPRSTFLSFRQVIFGAHRVIYRIEEDGVAILTVRRSKQLLDLKELGL